MEDDKNTPADSAGSPPPPQRPGPPDAPEASAAGARGAGTPYGLGAAGNSIGDSFGTALRGAPSVLRDFSVDFGNWLATISWWKFTLLSILLLIFGGMASSIVFSSNPNSPTVRTIGSGNVTVDVHVVPLPDGRLLVGSAAPKSLHVFGANKKSAAPSAAHASKDDDVLLQIDGDGTADSPAVRIDKDGVRVLADDEGRKVSVVIDHNGVRVEKAPPGATTGKGLTPPTPPAPPVPPVPAIPPPPAAPLAGGAAGAPVAIAGVSAGHQLLLDAPAADPDKTADAVEAARDQIENILQDQVDNKIEALGRDDQEERKSWIELLVSMAIVALIALKVVLGSKTRAEFQARKASATAAQEGLKRQLAEAQLKMMQAQVEPHFLFNTLASVDYLIETDPARASRMQKNLIQYLRAAVPQMREGSSNLGREILQCRSYLEILKVRMDERLQFSINVPQGLLTAAFPPMMLLTLVENAIKHGLEPKPDGGSLSLSAVVADGKLRVAVADSGLGFGKAQRGGTGVGLANVRERLFALYGASASLAIDANSDGGTIATILVPYQIEAAAAASGSSPAPVPAV